MDELDLGAFPPSTTPFPNVFALTGSTYAWVNIAHGPLLIAAGYFFFHLRALLIQLLFIESGVLHEIALLTAV